MSKLWHPGENTACDIVALTNQKVVLIQRKDTNAFALPGGFVDAGESPKEAATREFQEECQGTIHPSQLVALTPRGGQGVYRDPRDEADRWVTTHPFLVHLTNAQAKTLQAADDAKSLVILPVSEALQKITYADHREILKDALKRLKPGPAPTGPEP